MVSSYPFPSINVVEVDVRRFRRFMFSRLNTLSGITKMTTSVTIFTDALAKYIFDMLMQPSGNLLSHAREGLAPHSNILTKVTVMVCMTMKPAAQYTQRRKLWCVKIRW